MCIRDRQQCAHHRAIHRRQYPHHHRGHDVDDTDRLWRRCDRLRHTSFHSIYHRAISPVTVPGAKFELMLDVGIPITIATPSGWIGGVSGSYVSSRVLSNVTSDPRNRCFYSDGTNWNMLSVAGYNSSGYLTATRVNAGEFAINSTNITTIFAPRA